MTDDVHHVGDDRDETDLDDVLDEPDRGEEILAGEVVATMDGPTVDDDRDDADDEPDKVVCCRYCEIEFDRVEYVQRHYCRDQPVIACRYCGTTFADEDAWNDHKYQCDELLEAVSNERAQAIRDREFDEETYFIDTACHEFKAYVKYDCGLGVYYGLNSLQKEHNFSEDGALATTFEDDHGEEWEVEFSFSDSYLKPWDDPSFRIQNVREYVLNVHPKGVDHDDALRSVSFQPRPRWPDIESVEGYTDPSNPHDITGLDVEYDGSNIPFERYPDLFYHAMRALRGEQGTRYSNPTLIPADDVRPDQMHHSSNVVTAEVYVRLDKEKTGQIYALDGPLHRISTLLANEREGYAKSVRDDTKQEGYYHVATVGSMRAREIVGGHKLGKSIKHYHVEHPEAVDGDGMLEHPKLGVALRNRYTEETLYWDDLDRVTRELDEVLLNVLNWCDLPTRPDDQVFVEDDVFKVEGKRRFRKLVADPLPRIESQQNSEVVSFVNNAYETDVEITEQLITDGGQISPKKLAERIGKHIDTVYRSLKRLGGIVIHEYGEVRLASRNIGEQIVSHLEGLKQGIDQSLDRAASDLLRAETVAEETSAFDRWRNYYGVQFEESDDGERDRIKLGYTPESAREVKRILREGANKWAQLTGRRSKEFAFEFRPEIRLADGELFSPARWAQSFQVGSSKMTFGSGG